MTSRIAACATAALLVLLLVPVRASVAATSRPAHVRPDGHVVLAWLHGESVEEQRAQAEAMPGVSVVSPTWWSLDDRQPGAVVDDAEPEFVSWARERDLAVWPTLGNHLDGELTDAVLRHGDRREQLVDATAAAVERTGAAGVVVGFENLRARTGPALTAFVGDLRRALPGHTVAVTVAALTDAWTLGDWSTAYERRALGEAADYVVLQALDEHSDAQPGGPVAGLEWSLRVVERLLASVPDRKVLLAVPLYARDWVDDPESPRGVRLAATRGMDAMARHLAAVDAVHEFDPVAGQRRYTYTDAAGRRHRVWQEDPASLTRRTELATMYNLGGVAAWRGGFAGPEAWSAISSALAARPRSPGLTSGPPRMNRLIPAPRVAEPAPEEERRRTLETAATGPPGAARPVVVAATVLLTAVSGLLILRVRRADGRARR